MVNPDHLKILLIDDDEDDAMLFNEAISEISPEAEVTVFSRWENVLEYLENVSDTPNFIFMDYVLPGTNGNELAGKIRLNQKMSDVPLILCSGMCEQMKLEDEGTKNLDQSITKPSSFDQLVKMLRKVIDHEIVVN